MTRGAWGTFECQVQSATTKTLHSLHSLHSYFNINQFYHVLSHKSLGPTPPHGVFDTPSINLLETLKAGRCPKNRKKHQTQIHATLDATCCDIFCSSLCFSEESKTVFEWPKVAPKLWWWTEVALGFHEPNITINRFHRFHNSPHETPKSLLPWRQCGFSQGKLSVLRHFKSPTPIAPPCSALDCKSWLFF